MNTTRHSLIAAALLLTSSFASALTASNTFQVTATVISSCTVSGTTLNFGNTIDPLAAASPLDATSTLSVTCSNTTPYTVALNAGSRSLPYQLYLDTGRSSVWGDGTASSATVPGTGTGTGTGTGSEQTLSIYGRLPSLANVAPGAHTDTVTVTIPY